MLYQTKIAELEILMKRIAKEAGANVNAVQAGRTLERIQLIRDDGDEKR